MSGAANTLGLTVLAVPQSSIARRFLAIDAAVAGEAAGEEDAFIERLVLWASEKFGSDQLVAAKEEHFWKTGKAFPEDSFFHARMAYFLDYFLFQRPIDETELQYRGRTPFDIYRAEAPSCRPGWEVNNFCHSLFEVQKTAKGGLTVVDVFSGSRLDVSPKHGERHDGFSRKDIFQGYLYRTGERHVLSRGIVFHPSCGAAMIRSQIKKAMKGGDFDQVNILYRLARQQIRHLRHPHVAAKVIYAQDPR